MAGPVVDSGHSETTPLLHSQAPVAAYDAARAVEHSDAGCKRAETTDQRPTSWQHEAKTLALWSMPLLTSSVLQRSIPLICVFAVGRVGTTELGACSLANVTSNLVGNSIIQGLANSLDTLAAQAYGAGNKHLVGLHTQRMVCFILPCVAPLMVLWWKADDVLVHIIPDQQLAALTGLYLKIMTSRVPAFVLFECGKRYMQAQGLFSAATYVLFFAAPFNAVLMWFFVWHLGWGFVGAPIAVAITENLMPLLLFLYVWLVDGSQCWGGLSCKVFSNWGPMVRLAIPGMIMHVSEFAADEVLTVAAAQFGSAQLAAQSALVTLTQITWTVPLGLSIAASIRVGNWIGAKDTRSAKTAAKTAAVLGLIIAAFNTVILAALRCKIPLLFTDDVEVIGIIVQAFPVATVMQTGDAMAVIAHGLLRSIGCQEFGGYVNLAVYYLIALPLSLGTGFPLGWKVYGLWTGITTGACLVSIVEFWWLYRSDWQAAVAKAERRNEAG